LGGDGDKGDVAVRKDFGRKDARRNELDDIAFAGSNDAGSQKGQHEALAKIFEFEGVSGDEGEEGESDDFVAGVDDPEEKIDR
jgi:hypothetical protein